MLLWDPVLVTVTTTTVFWVTASVITATIFHVIVALRLIIDIVTMVVIILLNIAIAVAAFPWGWPLTLACSRCLLALRRVRIIVERLRLIACSTFASTGC